MLVIAMFAISVLSNAQEAQIKFEKTEHDFGEIAELGGAKEYIFKFTNAGNKPLIIQAVNTSCGCTTPTWTMEPVAPGKVGMITVVFNPRNRPGEFRKSISIVSNSKDQNTTLYIKGKVNKRELTIEQQYPRQIGDLRAKSNYVKIGDVKTTEIKQATLAVVNPSDKPVEVEFKNTNKEISITIEPKVLQPNERAEITVSYDGSKTNNYGSMIERVYILKDGKADYRNSIGISANIIEDFSFLSEKELAEAPNVSFETLSHDFGRIKEGDKVKHAFNLTNSGKSNLIIRKIKSTCGCTVLKTDKKIVVPGETIPLLVEFDSKGKLGRQTKTITVITNAPEAQQTTLRISATIDN